MDEIRQILDALGIHSLKVAAAIIIVVILTSLIKIPVKRAANKYVEQGGNKNLITSLIVFICLALSFIAALILELIRVGWNWSAIEWGGKISDVLPNWAVIAVMSSTLYAAIWSPAEKGISALFNLVTKKIFGEKNASIVVKDSPAIEEPAVTVTTIEEQPKQAKKKKPAEESPKPNEDNNGGRHIRL